LVGFVPQLGKQGYGNGMFVKSLALVRSWHFRHHRALCFARAYPLKLKKRRDPMNPDPFKFGRAYDLHELVADGIIHGIGVVFALVALPR